MSNSPKVTVINLQNVVIFPHGSKPMGFFGGRQRSFHRISGGGETASTWQVEKSLNSQNCLESDDFGECGKYLSIKPKTYPVAKKITKQLGSRLYTLDFQWIFCF